jgi:hypothetical protein
MVVGGIPQRRVQVVHDARLPTSMNQEEEQGKQYDGGCEQPQHPINVPIHPPSASKQGGCDAMRCTDFVPFGCLSSRSICRPPAHRAVSGELLRACGYGSASRETDCQTLFFFFFFLAFPPTPHPIHPPAHPRPHVCCRVIGNVSLGFFIDGLVPRFAFTVIMLIQGLGCCAVLCCEMDGFGFGFTNLGFMLFLADLFFFSLLLPSPVAWGVFWP